MNIKINYQDALEQYPVQVKDCIDQLRKGKSKYKNEPPDNLNWSIDWVQIIHGSMNGLEFINKMKDGSLFERKKEPDTPEEYWELMKNDIRSCLCCSVKKTSTFYSSKFEEIPIEIKINYVELWLENKKEQEKINNMSQEERNKRTSDLLKDLSKDSGFIMMSGFGNSNNGEDTNPFREKYKKYKK